MQGIQRIDGFSMIDLSTSNTDDETTQMHHGQYDIVKKKWRSEVKTENTLMEKMDENDR